MGISILIYKLYVGLTDFHLGPKCSPIDGEEGPRGLIEVELTVRIGRYTLEVERRVAIWVRYVRIDKGAVYSGISGGFIGDRGSSFG